MSASMNSTAWKSTIGRPNWRRSFAKARESSSARVAAPTVRAPIISRSSTNQSFVSSKPCPISPRTRSSPTSTSSNAKIGCSKTNVCMYFGVRTSRTPGVSLSTRKTVAFAGSPSTCVWRRKKSATSPEVTCHFSPVMRHVVAGPRRRGPHHRRVGAGALLGDRVRIPALAAAGGSKEPLLLLLGPGGERDRGPPRDVPEGPGGATPLLLDQHLLEEVVSAAAVLFRVVDRVEVPVEDRLLRSGVARRREAVVRLAFVLERHEDLVGEVARLLLELPVRGAQTEIHRRSVGGARRRSLPQTALDPADSTRLVSRPSRITHP